MTIVQLNLFTTASLCTYQWKSRGGGGCGQGGDLMPETIPPVGLFIMQSDPEVGTFDFDGPKAGI